MISSFYIAQRLIHVLAATLLLSSAGHTPHAPEIFSPNVISDSKWQWRITFTPNGRTAYFAVSDGFFPATRRSTIMVSHVDAAGNWSTPEVASFSGTFSDIDPFITPDGRQMFFTSIRPRDGNPAEDLDLFVMNKTKSGWSKPSRLGKEINTQQDELYASQSAAGTLCFASGPLAPTPDTDWNIYCAQRKGDGFAPRTPLHSINTDLPYDPADPTADWEFNPEISVDGRSLIFTSLRPGGHGLGDLYITRLVKGTWTGPVNLGPSVNTADDEFHPTLSRDGTTLYFARTRFRPTLTPSDFYAVAASEVAALPGGVRKRSY